MASFGSRFVHNWARLKYVGEGEPPSRDYVGKELLFKSNGLSTKDIYSFIALPNRREFELCFFQESVLRRFLEQYASKASDDVWKQWQIDSHISIDIVNIVVKFWTGRVSDHDVELYLSRYCNILEQPYKPVDQFGIWYGVRKYKVQVKSDGNNERRTIPSSISLGPYSGRIFYPGQVSRCFVCGSTEHQIRDCQEVKCWRCGDLGHKAKDCTNAAECSLCGGGGHSYFQCPQSYSNKARAQRKSLAEEQERTQMLELLRQSKNQPQEGATQTAALVQSAPQPDQSGSAPRAERPMERRAVRPATPAARRNLQVMYGRGRSRVRDAADTRAASAPRGLQQQSQQPAGGVGETAREDAATREILLMRAADIKLPPSCGDTGDEESEDEDGDFDSASEEPSLQDSSEQESSRGEDLPAAVEPATTEHVSAKQKRQSTPLKRDEKKHKLG